MTLNQRIELMLCAEESYIQQGIRDGILRDFAELEAKNQAQEADLVKHRALLLEHLAVIDPLRTQNQALRVAVKGLLGRLEAHDYEPQQGAVRAALAEGGV